MMWLRHKKEKRQLVPLHDSRTDRDVTEQRPLDAAPGRKSSAEQQENWIRFEPKIVDSLRSNIFGETSLGRSDVALTLNMTFFVAVMSGTNDQRDPAAEERKKRERNKK